MIEIQVVEEFPDERERMSYDDKYAQCPFFQRSLKKGVVCEGFTKRTTTSVVFDHIEDKKRYFQEKCCEDFERCPVYRSLMREKYED